VQPAVCWHATPKVIISLYLYFTALCRLKKYLAHCDMNNVVERLLYGTKTKENNNNNKISEIPCYCDLDSDRSEGKRFITELHFLLRKTMVVAFCEE